MTHCIVEGHDMVCRHCGHRERLSFPLPLSGVVDRLTSFQSDHDTCPEPCLSCGATEDLQVVFGRHLCPKCRGDA